MLSDLNFGREVFYCDVVKKKPPFEDDINILIYNRACTKGAHSKFKD